MPRPSPPDEPAPGGRPLFHIHTFGCQMNANDSERLAGLLVEAGFQPASSAEPCDLLIVNTCSVRAKSEEKLFSLLGRLAGAKEGGTPRLAVVGCSAQVHGDRIIDRVPGVDLVLGPDSYHLLPGLLGQPGRAVALDRSPGWREQAPRRYLRHSPASAFVTVMEGCDNFCSYCIVPFARGGEKYRPARLIESEVEKLLLDGYREIVFLGQNVNSYRDPESGRTLADLLRWAGGLPGVEWVRFLTSHPKNFGQDLIQAIGQTPRVCRMVHLPLQSGSSRVLERMNRGYGREDYLDLAARLRSAAPGLELTTDIIVGFPGETEGDFRETLDLLERVRFANIFSFKYSPRPLTSASKVEDDVPAGIKKRRLTELQALQRGIQLELNRSLLGEIRKVLITGRSKKNPEELSGRDESHRVVNVAAPAGPAPLHRFLEVRITGYGPYSLRGQVPSS